jgi:uncharacterized phage protein (TIGR01671 family)
MARELKFRAWDGIKMHNNVGVHPHMIKSLVKHDKCKNQDSDCDYEEGQDGSIIVCQRFEAYKIMQFTGLWDKNGKEIFEGDIVKTPTDKPMVISWSKKFASFIIDREGWMFSHWFGESFNGQDVEVVGNIYENAEILNSESK